MRSSWKLLLSTVFIMAVGYMIWPVIHPYMGVIKAWLIAFKQFCHENPLLGYTVYGSLLALILFLGLPFAMAVMLLAGITYDFWEATMLVMACRLLVAVAAFLLVRYIMDDHNTTRPQLAVLKKFECYPKIGLLLARLSPLPDTTVNYAMGASSLGCIQYAAISLLGMIPLTLFCVWMGNELGSITQLIKMLD